MIRRISASAAAAALLALYAVLAVGGALQHSPAQHERLYLYAGFQNLVSGRYDLHPGVPGGMVQLAAAPLLLLDLEDPAGPDDEARRLKDRFLYENRRPARHILMTARAPFLLLGAFTGWMVFVWARRLYGDAGGVLALAVYVLCPAVLGHAPLANQDFGVGALSLIALYALWCASERETPARVTAAGAALGAALLTKFTAVALVPVFVAVGLWNAWSRDGPLRGRRVARRALALAAMGAIAVLVVWADERFAVGSLGDARSALVSSHPDDAESVCPAGDRLPEWTVPAPYFVCGLSSQLFHGATGHRNYFAGETSTEGWWSYYAVTLLYKLPVPLLLLLALRVGLALRVLARGEPAPEAPFLLVYPALLFAVFSAGSTQLGERYLLAFYPCLFVWIGGLAREQLPVRWKVAGATALLGWLLVSTLRIHPHHLMYFNEIAGGPRRGWMTLVAGYDLGQDLGNLERYVRKNGIQDIAVRCKGCGAIGYYDIPARPLRCRPTQGTVAVSVHRLVLPKEPGCTDWLLERQPDDHVGYSIWIYRE